MEANPSSGLIDLHVEGVIDDAGLDLMVNQQMQSFSIAYYVLMSLRTGEHVGNILDELSVCVDPKIPGCIASVKNSNDPMLLVDINEENIKNFHQRQLTDNEINQVMSKMKHMHIGCKRLDDVSDIVPVKKLVYSMPVSHKYSKSTLKLKIGGRDEKNKKSPQPQHK